MTKEVLTCDSINWVNFNIDNVSVEWLVDTGASISAIKYDLLSSLGKDIKIYKTNIQVNGISGSLFSLGYCYLDLDFNKKRFRHKFYVFEKLSCKASGILGQDFIMKYNGVINYTNNTLCLTETNDSVVIPIQFYNYSYSLTIDPRCEVIRYVPVKANYECVVMPKTLKKGVFLAGIIATPSNGSIPVRILNTTLNTQTVTISNVHIHKLSEYNICSFNENHDNVDRLKSLFQLLNLNYLQKDEKISIENICAKYADIFHLPGEKLTVTNVYKQSIKLKDNVTPSYRKQYRIPFAHKNELQKQIDNMLKNNIIEEASSEWSSPLLLVPKKIDRSGERKWRVVIDYRKLNEKIQDDKFPLPNINEILDSLSGAMYFSHCDLSQGYYQCPLDKGKEYTAFTTDKGQYQMCRLPMGLKLSPSAFSRLMTVAMSGLNYDICLVYQDDLVIFGRNLEDHNKNLMSVFSRLRKVNLKLNPSKCEFLKRQILYLGHVISNEGILPDPEKISAIKNYPIPTNNDDVKRFVAFANYYRKFIRNFAKIVLPLNKLSRKGVPFIWTEDCKQSFLTLKNALSSPPVLDYPDLSTNNTFILQTDSSGFAIGSVLCNSNGKPVAYASRSLNKAELNYPIIEKELLAIVWSIKYFRPYLFGKKFIIKTDHKPLLYLFNMNDPSSRLTKFRLSLEEYDFEIEYVRGAENVTADALSRVKVTSDELRCMHEKVMTVMTRAQTRRMNEYRKNSENCELENDSEKSNFCQPKVVEILKKGENDVELTLITNEKLRKIIKTKDVSLHFSKSRIIVYMPEKSVCYINNDSLSVISRDELLKEIINFTNENK